MAPPVMNGLVLSLDAALGITKDGGNLISYWEDQSGQGNHFEQATGANKPTWYAQLPYHDFPYVDFNGNQKMTCIKGDMLNNAPGATMFVVIKMGTIGATYQTIFDVDQPTGLNNVRFRVSNKGAIGKEWTMRAGRVDGVGSVERDNAMGSVNSDHGYVLKVSVNCTDATGGIKQSKWMSEIKLTTTVPTTGNFSATDSILISIGKTDTDTLPLIGKIIELLVYNREVTTGESDSIFDYLNNKYFVRTKTVGVGGDFPDLDDALSYLDNAAAVIPLIDNFTINVLSDFTQLDDTVTHSVIVSANATVMVDINGNGHTIDLVGNGYTVVPFGVTVWWTDWSYGSYVTLNSGYHASYKYHDFVLKMLGIDDQYHSKLAIYICMAATDTEVYNIFIYAVEANAWRTGYKLQEQTGAAHFLKMYNCIFYNLRTGQSYIGGGGGSAPQYNKVIENCIFFNCGFGAIVTSMFGYALILYAANTMRVKYRNVSILRNDGVTGRDIRWIDNTCYFDNCATSDATTFADLAAAHPGQITNCLDALVATDELLSLVFGTIGFLYPRPKLGTGVFNGGIVPLVAVNDYDGIPYGVMGYYPIGPYQYVFDADFVGIPLIVYLGDTVQFTNLSVGDIVFCMWNFGDGINYSMTSGLDGTSHRFERVGVFTVKLQAMDSSGNIDVEEKVGYITVLPLALDFIGAPRSGPAALKVNYRAALS